MLRKVFNTLFHCIFHRVHKTELHKRLSLPPRRNVSATFQFTASLLLHSSTSTFPFFSKKEPVYRIPVHNHLTDIPLRFEKKYPLNCECALYCFWSENNYFLSENIESILECCHCICTIWMTKIPRRVFVESKNHDGMRKVEITEMKLWKVLALSRTWLRGDEEAKRSDFVSHCLYLYVSIGRSRSLWRPGIAKRKWRQERTK